VKRTHKRIIEAAHKRRAKRPAAEVASSRGSQNASTEIDVDIVPRVRVVPERDVEQLWTERVFVAVSDGTCGVQKTRSSGRCFEVKS
jgi:hypothetical protein